MPRPPAGFALLLSLACVLCTTAASADRKAAAELFRSGKASYARGDYVASAHAFEAAEAQEPSAAAAFNAALAWHAAGEHARALAACDRVLARDDTDPKLRREAEEFRAELAPKTGELAVRGSGARLTVAHARRVASPARVPLDPGVHRVILELPSGKRIERRVVVRAGERIDLEVPGPEEPAAPPPAPRPREPATRGIQWALGWTALGVGGAAASAASIVGWQGLAARDSYVDSGLSDLDARDRAVTFRTAANVSWAAAAALSVTGAVLLFTAPSPEPTRAELRLGPGSLHLRLPL